VLVISERLWRRRLGADPGVVGRLVELTRHPFTIVGVLPKPFRGAMSALAFDVKEGGRSSGSGAHQRLRGSLCSCWEGSRSPSPRSACTE
jgi:hypothetical protein